MLIKELFKDEIERYINPVIKVQEDNIEVVKSELQEYVITEQLRAHFKECLDKYLNDENKVGYWVSGWFGSGKSHFLKIFGYLLENHQFGDNSATDIFLRRDETNTLKPFVEQINDKYKTTVVMFDILEEAGKLEGKVEPIELTIYKQWLSKRGFYTGKLWVAEMEKELSDEGKYKEFIETIETMSGKKWADIRRTRMANNYIQRALVKVIPDQIPTETIAKDYIEDLEKGKATISASMLADELYKYIEELDKENGKNNRMFVIVDEIGQYISANTDVIGYLQAIESTFARKGKGKLWFAVSSQNKLEQITEQYLKTEDEINKVIDRFEVRIDLTPENLDKVINERVLKKKTEVLPKIEEIYENNKGKLLSVLEFKDFKKNLTKTDKDDFINTYPFMPYHIQLIQPIYYSVISKSKTNKKLGGTNRSMIKATQGIIIDQEIDFKNRDMGELVTLDMFFDQAKEFIDDQMELSIKEAAELDHDNGELLVKILKVLYLLDNDDKLQKDADTISKLLIDNVNSDFMKNLEDVKSGLDILYKYGYLEKDAQGNYKFIAPEEQSFRREAMSRTTEIGMRDINKNIKEIIEKIYDTTRINYKNIRTFDIQLSIDDEVRTNKGLVWIHLNSVMQSSDELRKNQHTMKSIGDNRNIYWYAKHDGTIDQDMEQYLIFKKIIEEYRRKWSSDEDKNYFLRKEEQKNIKLYEDIQEKIIKSFKNGTYIYQGKEFPVPEKNDIKSIFQEIANIAIPHIYHSFDMVGVKIEDDDIKDVFKDNQLSISLNNLNLIQDTNVNAESAVLKEVISEIKTLKNKNSQCIGKDLLSSFENEPYGWASGAVRLFTTLLFKNGNIELNYEGKDFLDYNQSGVRDIFEKEFNFKKAIFKLAVVVDASTRQRCQDILKEMFDENSDDTLVELYRNTRDTLVKYRNDISAIKQVIKDAGLPLADTIKELDIIFENILKSKTQGDTINNLVEKYVDYERSLKKYKKLYSFVYQDKNVKEYKDIESFLTGIWSIDQNKNSEDYEAKNNLKESIILDMNSESFMDSWTDIRSKYHELYDPYVKEYVDVHEKLCDLYNEKVSEIENNKSYIILKSYEAKSNISRILSDKVCCESVKNVEIPCTNCKKFIKDMNILIDAVDIYYEEAMARTYEYLNQQIECEREASPTGGEYDTPKPPKSVIKNVNRNEFPRGILIQNHKEVKDYLKTIEKQFMEIISGGDKIIIE